MRAGWWRRKGNERLEIRWAPGPDAWRVELWHQQDDRREPLSFPLPADPRYLTLPGSEVYLTLCHLQHLFTDPPHPLRRAVDVNWDEVSVEHFPYDLHYALLELCSGGIAADTHLDAAASGAATKDRAAHETDPGDAKAVDASAPPTFLSPDGDADGEDAWNEVRSLIPTWLEEVGLPIHPIAVRGRVELDSTPAEGRVRITLWDAKGRNLERSGRRYGPVMVRDGRQELLPLAVWELYKASAMTVQHGYQRLAACQRWAQAAGFELDDVLRREQYVLVDRYDVDVRQHAPDHIELVPTFEGQEIDVRGFSTKSGWQRTRFYPTPRVLEDLRQLQERRHIRGSEVAAFTADPLSVLPEHDYLFDFDGYSDRVKGLVPLVSVRPSDPVGGGRAWFEMEDGDGETSPIGDDVLRELVLAHPGEDFVLHEGRWVHIPPQVREQFIAGANEGEKPASHEKGTAPYPGDADAPERRTEGGAGWTPESGAGPIEPGSGPGGQEPPEDRVPVGMVLDIYENEEALEYALQTPQLAPDAAAVPLPAALKATLFDHQLSGFRWLVRQWDQGAGG
ncbi:MAG: hypothetical protein K6T67_12820, partial [Alicyclobacillus sp.]|nr:hypothetical protein [Alicyclobacillus sp.]